jgi:hypothetical protein
LAFYVVLYVFYCEKCKRRLYVVNGRRMANGRRGLRDLQLTCCDARMKYQGKVRLVVPEEDYRALVEKRVFEPRELDVPLPLPRNFGGEYRSWEHVFEEYAKNAERPDSPAVAGVSDG